MNKKTTIILFIFLFALLVKTVSAAPPDHVLVNSEDWRDVYSVMLYGSLNEISSSFLVSDKHASLILNAIDKDTHLWLVNSRRVPYFVGYASVIEGKGYSVEDFSYSDINLQLAEESDVTNFIIVDDSYGYNAVSVAPYAVVSNSYVLFADDTNIGDVTAFLEDRTVDDVLIYGHVDREVLAELAQYDPEIINADGDRFDNNIEIVRKYLEIRPAKQAILTNGEFIEGEIMLGDEPVIFIGSNNVPDQTREFIHESGIEIGVLIGNELVGTATFIRRQIGISVFVKFAQGARAAQGAISQVEALDMFYIPTYLLNLEIVSFVYNQATNQIEVSFRNTVDQAIYFKGTYSLKTANGETIKVGDIESVFIDGQEVKTLVYDVDALDEGNISVDIYVIYGESKGALEKVIDLSMAVDTVKILDNCVIDLKGLTYSTQRKLFYIEVENVADVNCYVDGEVIDVVVAGEKISFGMDSVQGLQPGETKQLKIRAELENEDLEDNEKVKVRVYYGERAENLVKTIEGDFELALKKADSLFYILVAVVILLFFLVLLTRKKKCDSCGHRNPRRESHCMKCKRKL